MTISFYFLLNKLETYYSLQFLVVLFLLQIILNNLQINYYYKTMKKS